MNLDQLSPETVAWLKAQVQQGHFASYEDAIDYTVQLTSLRETLYASIAVPRRHTGEQVSANLRAHFAERARENSSR